MRLGSDASPHLDVDVTSDGHLAASPIPWWRGAPAERVVTNVSVSPMSIR